MLVTKIKCSEILTEYKYTLTLASVMGQPKNVNDTLLPKKLFLMIRLSPLNSTVDWTW